MKSLRNRIDDHCHPGDRAAWTLFEMVTVLTIMALAMGMFLPLLLHMHSAQKSLTAQFATQRSLATLATRFREDARRARAFHWDASDSSGDQPLTLAAMTLILPDRQVQYQQTGPAIRRFAFAVLTLASRYVVVKPLAVEAFEFPTGLRAEWSDRPVTPNRLLRLRLMVPNGNQLGPWQQVELIGGCGEARDA